jgi:hypothetical protein
MARMVARAWRAPYARPVALESRMRRSRRFAATLGLLPLFATALAACSETPEDAKFAPACPALSLLKDADNVTRFSGSGHDVTQMLMAARITAVPAKCMREDATHVRAVLSVAADVMRGPAAGRDAFNVRYFVAVTEGDRVLQEQDFAMPARFRPNVDQIKTSGEEIELLLPVTKTKSAAAYHIYIGFRLTPEELAYNRAQQR